MREDEGYKFLLIGTISMAKGQAQRRRAKNFLEAKVGRSSLRHCLISLEIAECAVLDSYSLQETKSGRLLRLPPPPDNTSKKGKRNSDVPRSLQRMLELKVGMSLCRPAM